MADAVANATRVSSGVSVGDNGNLLCVVIVDGVVSVYGVAVLAATYLRVDWALAAGWRDGRRTGGLAPSGESVEGSSWFVVPKSVLIIVIVEHVVTPSKGPAEAHSAVKMTICLLPS